MLKRPQISIALCITAIITVAALTFITAALFRDDYIPIHTEQTYEIFDWERVDDKNIIYLSKKLDAPPPYIMFRTTYSGVTVKLAGTQIYSYGIENNRPFGKKPPRAFHFINLGGASSGMELEINVEGYRGTKPPYISEISGGAKDALIYRIVTKNAFNAIYSVLFLIAGVILLCVYLFSLRAEMEMAFAFRRALSLSSIAFLVSLWQGCESHIIELFFPYSYTLYAVAFLSLMWLPIPILRFAVQDRDTGHAKYTTALTVILYANFFICVALQVLSMVDFKESIISTHILICITIAYGVYILFICGVKKQALLFAGLVALSVGTVADLAMYYINANSAGYVFINTGFAALFILLVYQYASEAVRSYTQNVRSKEILEMHNKEIIRTVEIQQGYYKNLSNQLDDTRRMLHDFQQFKTILYGILEQKSFEKAQALYDQMGDSSRLGLICENIEIGSLISYAMQKCKEHDIQYEYNIQVPADVKGISIYDICIVIGNLLDNAIEAAAKCSGKRYVKINAVLREDGLYIRVENNYSGELSIHGERLMSTKKDGERHGFGVSIVKEIMAKYGGIFSTKHSDGRFLATAAWIISSNPQNGLP